MKKTSIIILGIFAAIMTSCAPDVVMEPEASIVFEEGQSLAVSIAPEGEVVDIRFISSLEWTTDYTASTPDTQWIQAIPSSGKGGDSLCKIKFAKNDSGAERNVSFAIMSGDITKRILFSQTSLANDYPDSPDNPDNGNEDDGNIDDGIDDPGNNDGGNEDDGGADDGNDDSGNNDDGGNDDGNDDGGSDDGGSDDTPPATDVESGKYNWFELPQFSYVQDGKYMIDASDNDLYYAHHLCAGNEKGPGGRKARNYTVCYSAEHHCPVWVAAPRHDMYEGSTERTDAYGKDPDIPSGIQYNSKSTGGGCNKGHMLGSAERTSSRGTNEQVFYYTNIAPQYSSTFNTGGGGWNTLEDWVDGQVCSDTLYVVIGAYFDKYTDRRGYSASPKKISFGGRSDVSCPTMFYYILMRTKKGNSGKSLSQCTASEIKCAAFVRSHETDKGTKVSSQDLMSVSDLEKLTGFTYFPNVPHAPKDSYNASDWGL